MPEELSEEELAQREFFVSLQKSEVLKRILQPDFDEAARELCLQCTGQMCNSLFLPYAGLNTDTDIDTFMQDLMNAFPGMRKLERKGDVIHYDFYPEVKGECMCPMIALGHLEPTPLWCRCGNYFNKAMFEGIVKHPVQVELLDSPLTTGSDFCRRLIHLKPPVSSTRAMRGNSEKVAEETSVDARGAIDRMLSLRREIEIKEDKTVRELMDELRLSSAALLEVNGEIFYPDRIKDRRLRRGDEVILLPWIVGG